MQQKLEGCSVCSVAPDHFCVSALGAFIPDVCDTLGPATIKTARETGATKRGFVQFKGGPVPCYSAIGSQCGGHRFPLQALGPLTESLSNCLLVGHSPQVLIARVRRVPLKV